MTQNEVLKTWDSYVKEASRPILKIKVSDKQTVTIPHPTGEQMLNAEDLQRAGATGREQLANICGDAFDEVYELVKVAPGGALVALVSDIMDHYGFNLGELSASQT